MIVSYELLNNVETVRTVAGGKFLSNKWNDSVEIKARMQLAQEVYQTLLLLFSNRFANTQAGIVCYGLFL